MAVDSATELVNVLRANRLLSSSQFEELGRDLQRRYPEAKALGRALIDKQWLTPYQVNLLLQGAADKLVLGPYVILERLGDNALGQVHKARHQLMNRLVMLTVVREELLNQPKAVEQFYNEIQAVSQLSDPHLIHAYDAGPIGRTHFFATEYVDGVDLERLVAQSGRLPVATACSFIRQTALGLQNAYERGLLHHDLRPSNVLVAKVAPGGGGSVSITARTPAPSQTQLREATIKIANLGLSLLQPRLRANGKGDGTTDFVAPEQAQSRPDIRSNLYSLGCIFYYLLAGKSPFSSDSSAKLRQADTPRPLETYRRDVPAPIRDVIHKLMAAQPDDRYSTPAELLAALANGVDSRLLPSAAAPRRAFRGLIGLRGALAAAVVLLVCLLAGLSVWLLRSDKTSQPAPTAHGAAPPSQPPAQYVKRGGYEETILATLKASGLPSLEGTWYTAAPFDHNDRKGFAAVYPPETEIDLRAAYAGKDGQRVTWKPWSNFRPGVVHDLKPRSSKDNWAVMYLLHELEVPYPVALDLSLGSDDTISVWLNGKKLLANEIYRGAGADQDFVTLNLEPGKNQLLVKVCQGTGDWKFYIMPSWPNGVLNQLDENLQRDFPDRSFKYLADLPEQEAHVGHGAFGKNGDLGYGDAKVIVNGSPASHSLSMHPPGGGTARALYHLAKRYKSFKAVVALNDTGSKEPAEPVVFSLAADGKEVWKSRPLRKAGETQECAVSVKNVQRLELRATCPNGNAHCHAVWLEPHVNR